VAQHIDSNGKVDPEGEDHGLAECLVLWAITHDTFVHGFLFLGMHFMMTLAQILFV
jgi:hypothetical protein